MPKKTYGRSHFRSVLNGLFIVAGQKMFCSYKRSHSSLSLCLFLQNSAAPVPLAPHLRKPKCLLSSVFLSGQKNFLSLQKTRFPPLSLSFSFCLFLQDSAAPVPLANRSCENKMPPFSRFL